MQKLRENSSKKAWSTAEQWQADALGVFREDMTPKISEIEKLFAYKKICIYAYVENQIKIFLTVLKNENHVLSRIFGKFPFKIK